MYLYHQDDSAAFDISKLTKRVPGGGRGRGRGQKDKVTEKPKEATPLKKGKVYPLSRKASNAAGSKSNNFELDYVFQAVKVSCFKFT